MKCANNKTRNQLRHKEWSWPPFFSKLRIRGVSQCGRSRYVHCSDERSEELERATNGLLLQEDAVLEFRACCDKFMRILLLQVCLLGQEEREASELPLLCSKLHIVCEYNATVELVSTCHRMRMWTWVWARACLPVVLLLQFGFS